MTTHKHHYHRHFSGALYGILLFLALLLLGVYLISTPAEHSPSDIETYGGVLP